MHEGQKLKQLLPFGKLSGEEIADKLEVSKSKLYYHLRKETIPREFLAVVKKVFNIDILNTSNDRQSDSIKLEMSYEQLLTEFFQLQASNKTLNHVVARLMAKNFDQSIEAAVKELADTTTIHLTEMIGKQ